MSKHFTELGLGTPEIQLINPPEDLEVTGEKPAVKEGLKGQPKSPSRREFLREALAAAVGVATGGIMGERVEAQDIKKANAVQIVVEGVNHPSLFGMVKANQDITDAIPTKYRGSFQVSSNSGALTSSEVAVVATIGRRSRDNQRQTNADIIEGGVRRDGGREARTQSGRIPGVRRIPETIDSVLGIFIDQTKSRQTISVPIALEYARGQAVSDGRGKGRRTYYSSEAEKPTVEKTVWYYEIQKVTDRFGRDKYKLLREGEQDPPELNINLNIPDEVASDIKRLQAWLAVRSIAKTLNEKDGGKRIQHYLNVVME